MSKINIQRTIDSINSRTNSYTPIIEAVVNSIEAIEESKNTKGEIIITLKREEVLNLDDTTPYVQSIEIRDNGVGFTQKNRDSFDTFYSDIKNSTGGKGFGRFMFLKFFNDVKIHSIYRYDDCYYKRSFSFGKKFDIIENEVNVKIDKSELSTVIELIGIKNKASLDKGIDTIARRLVEKLLIFFINDAYKCPKIILKDEDGSKEITLNNYVENGRDIVLLNNADIEILSKINNSKHTFTLKTFKIYYSRNQRSKISLAADNREVLETPLHCYIPEFEDEFFEESNNGDGKAHKKNYVVKTYVLSKYLNQHVSNERDKFNFDKEQTDEFYPISQTEIEENVSEHLRSIFDKDVSVRYKKKIDRINTYIKENAPWHIPYFAEINLKQVPYNINDEQIEIEFQKVKFKKEIETRNEVKRILNENNPDFEEKLDALISKITSIGMTDLAHYVGNRKVVLEFFKESLKRREDGKGNLEKEIHNLIFPMGKDSTKINYESHNLWLLDERLVFAEYIASDRKIYKSKNSGEPDLIIFDKKQSFRNGDNEYSNPLTIFEFKRPKRETYKQDDDPILQIGNYLMEIRAGKYETPQGVEKIKVNDNTPVCAYVICDISDKIKEFAKIHQLTIAPDGEGYFGYHNGFKMYVEVISFNKLLKDAKLRNKIFFEKLHL